MKVKVPFGFDSVGYIEVEFRGEKYVCVRLDGHP